MPSVVRCLLCVWAIVTPVSLLSCAPRIPQEGPELKKKWDNPDADRLVITNDGKLIVSSANGRLWIWDVATAKVKLDVKEQDGDSPIPFALTGDDKELVAGYKHKVIVWNLSTLEKVTSIGIEEASVTSLAVGKDYLAVGTDDLAVTLYDRVSLKKAHVFGEPEGFRNNAKLLFLRFSEEGNQLVCGLHANARDSGGCEVLRILDIDKKREISMIEDYPNDQSQWKKPLLGDVAISRDGEMAASVGCHGHLMVWESSSGKLIGEFGKRKGRPSGTTPIRYFNVAFCLDDKHVAVSDMFGNVLIWNIKTKIVEHKLEHKQNDETIRGLLRMACSANGRFVVSAGSEQIFVWDLKHEK